MYIVSFINTSGKVLEVTTDANTLPLLCDIFENSNDVIKFKVSGSQGEINQTFFGLGGYSKWLRSFHE